MKLSSLLMEMVEARLTKGHLGFIFIHVTSTLFTLERNRKGRKKRTDTIYVQKEISCKVNKIRVPFLFVVNL